MPPTIARTLCITVFLFAFALVGCTFRHEYGEADAVHGPGYPVDDRGVGSEEKPLNGLKIGGVPD